MTDQSKKSEQVTLPGIPAIISSPALEAGNSRSNGQAGPKEEKSGPEAVPVSRFRARDSDRDMPINDTSGPLFSNLSLSFDLQWSLANKLQALMDENGSPLYELIWSQMDMPAGLPICRLRASARPISAIDCGGWPTPTAQPDNRTPEQYMKMRNKLGAKTATNLHVAAKMAGWKTPKERDYRGGMPERMTGREWSGDLNDQVQIVMTGWPTPKAQDQRGGGREPTTEHGMGLNDVAGWATPTAEDHRRGVKPPRPHDKGVPLTQQIGMMLAGWGTPRTSRGYGNPDRSEDGKSRLEDQVQGTWPTPNATDGSKAPKKFKRGNPSLVGMALSSFPAQTEKPGQLNPEFSRWLMGYPAEWGCCAAMVMQSYRKSGRSS